MIVPLDQQIKACEGAVNGEVFDVEAMKAAVLTLGVLQRDPHAAREFFRLLLTQPGLAAVFREFPGAQIKEVRRIPEPKEPSWRNDHPGADWPGWEERN